jgi:hypothetical protein
MIVDQMEGVPDSIRHGKSGFTSFCVLCLAGLVAFVLVQQPDQYCFAPPAHNLTSRLVNGCLLVELASAAAGFVALFLDRKRTFAVLTVALLLPVFFADALAKGCW